MKGRKNKNKIKNMAQNTNNQDSTNLSHSPVNTQSNDDVMLPHVASAVPVSSHDETVYSTSCRQHRPADPHLRSLSNESPLPVGGRSGRDVTDSAEQPRHMEPQLRSADAVASGDDRGKIDSSGQPRLPADALSCIGGVAFSDCDERDGTNRAQRLQRGGTGRENHQIDFSSDNDESNDEFSSKSEVDYGSKHDHYRDGQTIRISKYKNMRENANHPQNSRRPS